jgi:hypothetical protein
MRSFNASTLRTWQSFLTIQIPTNAADTPPTLQTLGDVAAALLQGPSQPLRAKLITIISLWNGLLVVTKSSAHLVDLPPANATHCYGTSVAAVVAARQACAATFPRGCAVSGFGLWNNVSNTSDVYCTPAKSIADFLAAQTPRMATGFSTVQQSISTATTAAAQWIRRIHTQDIPPINDTAVRTLLADLATLRTLTDNVRGYMNGTLRTGDASMPPCNVSNPVLETTYATLFARLLYPLDLTQYLHSVITSSRSIDASLQGAMFQQLSATEHLLETALGNGGGTPRPACLNTGASACTGAQRQSAIRYIQSAQNAARQVALKALFEVKRAFTFQALDSTVLNLASLPALTTASQFENALSQLDSASSALQHTLGGSGQSEKLIFDFVREDHPLEFASLIETGLSTCSPRPLLFTQTSTRAGMRCL